MSIDILGALQAQESCTANDVSVRQRFEEPDFINGVLTLSARGKTITVKPPTVSLGEPGAVAVSPGLACDGIRRFYFLHPILGEVSAFDETGSVLWRTKLPGFRSLAEAPNAASMDVGRMVAHLHEDHSLGLGIGAARGYVLAEFKTGERGFTLVVFHRSGRLVGSMGPGRVKYLRPDSDGWAVVRGDGFDMRTFVPREECLVQVSAGEAREIDAMIAHFVAWFVPRPTARQFQLECAGRTEADIKYILGVGFDPVIARRTRSIFATQGQSWFDSVKGRDPVSSVLARFNPTESRWVDEFKAALVEAGADVLAVQAFGTNRRH